MQKIEIPLDKIEEALIGRTLTEAAEFLGIGRQTLCNRIKDFGIGKGRGNYDRTYRRRKKRSVVHQKLIERKGQRLPGDPAKLAKILGVRPETIRAYLTRGKKSTERFLKEVLTKANPNMYLYDMLGVPYRLYSVKKMQVLLDQWGRRIKIIGTLADGSQVVFNYRVADLWNMLEGHNAN